MSVTAAAYKPEMQVMVLKPEFEAFTKPGKPVVISTPEQVAIFVHEWMHYLHNLSTVVGAASFSTLTTIWSNFRGTFGEDGWSHGASDIEIAEAEGMERMYSHMGSWRGARPTTLPKAAMLQDVRLTEIKLVPVGTAREGELQLMLLECSVSYQSSAEAPVSMHKVMVGTHEILEFAAFMLEERAAIALGTATSSPAFYPYLVLPAIASLAAPSLSKDEVLLAALASLQYPDPSQVILHLLDRGESASAAGQDVRQVLRDEGSRFLELCLPSVEAAFAQVEEIFPLDEPMGRAVKVTIARMRANLKRRRKDLFFELDIVERLREDNQTLHEAIREYGLPVLIQERRGDIDTPMRDTMFAILAQDVQVRELSEGWGLMHAAYRFMGSHFCGGKLQATENAEASRCPFYTVCSHDRRMQESAQCRSRPWLAAAAESDDCDYSVAVRKTRLLQDSSNSSKGCEAASPEP